MAEVLTKQKNIGLSVKQYQALAEAYQKLGELFAVENQAKQKPSLKTLKGIWKGVEVNDEDFEVAEKSLFKTAL